MLDILKKFYRLIRDHVRGNVHYQPFLEKLSHSTLLAMNYGLGWNISTSGEIYVLNYIKTYLENRLESPFVVFDVGANDGEYSLNVLNIFDIKARVLAFEPSATTFRTLSRNLKNATNVETYNLGLSSCSKTQTLFSDVERSSKLATLYRSVIEQSQTVEVQQENVVLIKLDDFCSEQNIEYIHLLKLDVEGHEIEVLKGASRMIDEQRIDFIQFEFGTCSLDARIYLRDFFELLGGKYDLYRIMKNGLYPLTHYKYMYEVFYTTNFLAKVRN